LLRDVTWSFPGYLLVAAPSLAVALAANASRIDSSVDAPSVREQYFRNSPPVYLLLSCFPILIILASIATEFRNTILNPPNLVAVSAVRLFSFCLLVTLARSKNEKTHWFALSALLLIAISFITRLSFKLVE
jgi:cytochrome bd-type quinol oxidase subunit 2